jgi:hypothetical protein
MVHINPTACVLFLWLIQPYVASPTEKMGIEDTVNRNNILYVICFIQAMDIYNELSQNIHTCIDYTYDLSG